METFERLPFELRAVVRGYLSTPSADAIRALGRFSSLWDLLRETDCIDKSGPSSEEMIRADFCEIVTAYMNGYSLYD